MVFGCLPIFLDCSFYIYTHTYTYIHISQLHLIPIDFKTISNKLVMVISGSTWFGRHIWRGVLGSTTSPTSIPILIGSPALAGKHMWRGIGKSHTI